MNTTIWIITGLTIALAGAFFAIGYFARFSAEAHRQLRDAPAPIRHIGLDVTTTEGIIEAARKLDPEELAAIRESWKTAHRDQPVVMLQYAKPSRVDRMRSRRTPSVNIAVGGLIRNGDLPLVIPDGSESLNSQEDNK